MNARRGALVALLLTIGMAWPRAQDPSRIVVVADLHGDVAQFVTVLRDAGVIDGKRKWIGGTTALVQTGDVPDRGPASRQILDLLMELQRQAPRAGGVVHALLGNHEVMNMTGDLRYVTREEYASYRSPQSIALRDRAYELFSDPTQRRVSSYRQAWMDERPLGWVELQQAFDHKGVYGAWLRSNDVMTRIGDTLFVHGGVSPAFADVSRDEVNRRVRAALEAHSPLDEPLLGADGPLWYRGLALDDEQTLTAHVDALLAFHGVARIVVGHTVTPGAVLPRFNGKVILNDVGLAKFYGGPAASLQIEPGRLTVRHRGATVTLPASGDLRGYLQILSALEPPGSKLKAWIADGARWPLPRRPSTE